MSVEVENPNPSGATYLLSDGEYLVIKTLNDLNQSIAGLTNVIRSKH